MFYIVKREINIHLWDFVLWYNPASSDRRQKDFMELERSIVETNQIHLNIVQAGPSSGVPVIFLHGFPEFWYGWIQPTKGIGINEKVYYLPIEKCAECMI